MFVKKKSCIISCFDSNPKSQKMYLKNLRNTGTVPWKITQIVSRKKTLGRVKATLQGP